jgi:hypothetical protein
MAQAPPGPEQGRLDGGAVIGRVFAIYVEQAQVLMPAAAVVFVFTGLLSSLLVTASPGLRIVSVLISLVAITLFTGMVVELVSDVQDGRRDASARQLLQTVAPVFGQLAIVGLVVSIAVVLGLIALVVPGLVLITIWSVAAPVVVLERPPGLGALARSRELVRGSGWQVFLVILVLGVLVSILAGAIDYAAESTDASLGLAVGVVLGVLTAPLLALAQAVMYFDLRGRAARPAGGLGAPEPT